MDNRNRYRFGEPIDTGGGPRRAPRLTPQQEQSVLEELAGQTWGAIETIGKVIDTPANYVRGRLIDDIEGATTWDTNRRVSGQELLSRYGVDYGNPYANAAAGLVAEIAIDPLLLFSGPLRALTAGGKAAKAAGLLDLAPTAAMKKMGGYSQAAKTLTGRYTDDAFRRTLPEIAQSAGSPAAAAVPDAVKARPLLGPRLSRSMVSLDDLVRASDNQSDAMKRVQNYLDANNLRYDDIKDAPVGGAFGFGFGEPSFVFTPPGSAKALDALDMLGQRIAWSAPVRRGSAWFDKRMRGLTGVGAQIDMLRLAGLESEYVERQRDLLSRYLQNFSDASPATEAALGPGGLMGAKGNSMLTRSFESVPTQADSALLRNNPMVQRGVDEWDVLRDSMLKEAKDMGLIRRKYGDKYGVEFSPRYANEIVLAESAGSPTSRSIYNTRLEEGNARKGYLQVPGGTEELREISMLPFVREHARLKGDSPYSNQDIGQMIADYMEQKYGAKVIGIKQGTLMANFMRNLHPDLPANYPLFAEHPLNAQARRVINHGRNVANARFLFDKLAEQAVQAYPSTLVGGGWRSLDSALLDVARQAGLRIDRKTGAVSKDAVRQVVDRIAARLPHVKRSTIDISKYAIPQTVYDRLMRVNDVFNSPKAWRDVWGLFEGMTTLFKSFILAWPSRHVRDAYSNALSVWLETGDASRTLRGMWTASQFLGQNFDAAVPELRRIPQYAKLASDEDVRRAFQNDAGRTGILSTLSSSDLLSARQQAGLSELVPGSTPVRISDAVRELVPDGSRNPLQMVRDFATIQNIRGSFQTRNPLLNASQKINDANDSIARLGGFIALMQSGVAPDVAAKRIIDALVDYSSTTDIERNVFKVIFPWWTYSSRAGSYVFRHMLENPGGRYAQLVRTMNTLQQGEGEEYIPSRLKQQFAVRIPDELLPYIGRTPSDEVTTYLRNFDVPAAGQVQTLAFSPSGLDVAETMQNLAQQAHPLIRTIGELVSDTDFFSGRPLSESVTPLDRIYQSLFGTQRRLSPVTKAVIQNIPGLQRPISLIGGLTDRRIPDFRERVAKQVVNQISGFGETDVDENYRDSDIIAKGQKNLKGWTSSKNIDFIPEELKPEVPENLMRQYLFIQEVERRKQARYRKERQQAEAAGK